MMSSALRGRARRLLVFVNDTDQVGRHSLYAEIVDEARRSGLAGATVLRAVEGFGVGGELHTTRLLSLTESLPMVILIIDDPDKIDAFLPRLDALMSEGMVAIDDVDVIEFVPDDEADQRADP